jgi:hypothetical protein
VAATQDITQIVQSASGAHTLQNNTGGRRRSTAILLVEFSHEEANALAIAAEGTKAEKAGGPWGDCSGLEKPAAIIAARCRVDRSSLQEAQAQLYINGSVAGWLLAKEAAVNSPKLASPKRCKNASVVAKRSRPSAPANSSTSLNSRSVKPGNLELVVRLSSRISGDRVVFFFRDDTGWHCPSDIIADGQPITDVTGF